MTTRTSIDVRIRTWLLSTVVTRIIKAPPVELTQRHVEAPEAVDVPTRHGHVTCYLTRPPADAPLATAGERPPVHVNIHGGAFIIGAPRQDDHLVRAIAGEVGAIVVNIDYSTAPAARFPRAVEECFDVLKWVAAAGEEMAWDADRISIGGGSSGGTLALGVLELARRHGGPQVQTAAVIAPLVDLTIPPGEYVSPAGKAFVTPALMRTVQWAYFTDHSEVADPLASPTLADMRNLPPLLVISAGRDTLRSQIEAYVEKATANGVTVTSQCFEDLDHDFPISRSVQVRPQQLEMTALICDHLLQHLSPSVVE
jgi:acetyl esterase